MQLTAMATLAKEIIDPTEWQRGFVSPTSALIPDELNERVENANQKELELGDLISVLSTNIR